MFIRKAIRLWLVCSSHTKKLEVNKMKTRILSILLLVMVLTMTMTACGLKDKQSTTPTNGPTSTEATEATEPLETKPAEATEPLATEAAKATEPLATDAAKPTEPELKAPTFSDLITTPLNAETVSNFVNEMVRFSAEEELSEYDMQELGWNFDCIFRVMNNDFHEDDLHEVFNYEFYDWTSDQACEVFVNVLKQAEEKQIPVYRLSSWTYVPVADILITYFSSASVDFPQYIDCPALYYLEEADAISVAKLFLAKPCLKWNFHLAFDAICSPYTEVKSMGLEQLTEISKSTFADYINTIGLYNAVSDNSYINDVLTAEKLAEIRENIMKNRYFDFVQKYATFCNSADETVATQAFQCLLVVAKDADDETAMLIKEVADQLWNIDSAQQLLDVLEESHA